MGSHQSSYKHEDSIVVKTLHLNQNVNIMMVLEVKTMSKVSGIPHLATMNICKIVHRILSNSC